MTPADAPEPAGRDVAAILNNPALGDAGRAAALRDAARNPDARQFLANMQDWRSRLAGRCDALRRDLTKIPEIRVYPTMGDLRGPYAEMYGKEERPNPEYERVQSEIADAEHVIAVVDEAIRLAQL